MRSSKMILKYMAAKMNGFAVLLLVTLATLTATAQDNEGFVVDEVISKVDNFIVLKSDLDKYYQDHLTNGGSPSQEVKCQMLAMLVRNKLMMAKAEIDSVVVLDAEVDNNTQRRMSMILAQSGRTPEELEQFYGKPLEQIKLELRDQIREQMIVQKMESTITEKVSVTPNEVKRFFDNIPKDSLPYFSASVEVAQIVKIAESSKAQKEAAKNQLLDLRTRILSGEGFSSLASKYSDDPSVVQNKGDMGWVGRGEMVPEFEAMAFKLKPNEISMPFQSDFGFHILQLIERRGNEYHSRHILIAPKPSSDDLKAASHFLDSIRTLILADSMKFEAAAKKHSDDVSTKGNGGYFLDQAGSTKVQIDELDPIVFFKVDSMKVGDISKPITYRTDDQKDAVRILYYKSRIPPHLASLKEDYQKIQMATLNQKKNRILEKWFLKARQDVFINIDRNYDYCGILD